MAPVTEMIKMDITERTSATAAWTKAACWTLPAVMTT